MKITTTRHFEHGKGGCRVHIFSRDDEATYDISIYGPDGTGTKYREDRELKTLKAFVELLQEVYEELRK